MCASGETGIGYLPLSLSTLVFLKQELSLKLELTDWLDYLTNKLQGLPVSTLPLGLLTFVGTTSFLVGDRNPGSGPRG